MALEVNLPSKVGRALPYRFSCTGFSNDHIQRSSSSSSVFIMHIINQVLIIRVGMNCLQMSMYNT